MYDEGLAGLEWLQLPVTRSYAYSSRHNYVVRLAGRDGFMDYLRDKGIATGMHYIPNHLYDMYRPYVTEPLVVTEREWVKMVTLPVYPDLTDSQVNCIIEAIRQYPEKHTVGEKLGVLNA